MIRSNPSLATLVEEYPITAENVFDRVEGALNLVLPGSDTHERYLGIEAVAFALAVGPDTNIPGYYSPLNPEVFDRLSFISDNQAEAPEAWAPKVGDAEILGGEIEDMGRFVAMLLAKMSTLTLRGNRKSSFDEEISVAPGAVGFAGGLRIANLLRESSLAASSGLFELHDHVGTLVFDVEMQAEVDAQTSGLVLPGETTARGADDLAADLTAIFEQLKSHYPVANVTKMKRRDLRLGINAANMLVAQYRKRLLPVS